MKLCEVRCTVLEMTCEGVADIMTDMKVTDPGPNVVGISYDDFTFGFIKDKSEVIREGECN